MSRQDRRAKTRTRIEHRARERLATNHAIFTWSIADAVESVLAYLALPDRSTLVIAGPAPHDVIELVRVLGHDVVMIADDPTQPTIAAPGAWEVIDDQAVAAVLACHSSGSAPSPALWDIVDSLTMPIVSLGVNLAPDARRRLGAGTRFPVATCVSLGSSGFPAAVVATDDPALAAFAADRRLGHHGPDREHDAASASTNGSPRDSAHLDRWASAAAAHATSGPLAELVNGAGSEIHLHDDADAPSMSPPFEHLHQGFGRRAAKRGFDIVIGCLLLAAALPLMVVIALVLQLTQGSPILFRQVRVGRHGKHFEMLKFRTMVVGADLLLADVAADNERHGPLFKLAADPRATMAGRILRRTSLDELPQLFNVLDGTMSLVGPRPALPAETATFPPVLRMRECVRPGITGLWQVEARDDASFERYIELDLAYVRSCSLALDLSILRRTPNAVVATALLSPLFQRRTPAHSVHHDAGAASDAGDAVREGDAEALASPRPLRVAGIPGAVFRRRARRSARQPHARTLDRRPK